MNNNELRTTNSIEQKKLKQFDGMKTTNKVRSNQEKQHKYNNNNDNDEYSNRPATTTNNENM